MKKNIWAIVVAAGRGERFGKPYNKVFHKIDGISILTRSLSALERANVFDGLVLVLSDQDDTAYAELTAQEGACALVKKIVHGGAARQESVMNGLLALPENTDIVAIHDAARPYIAGNLIHELIEAAVEHGAALPGTPMTDTVKQMDREGYAVSTPDTDAMRPSIEINQILFRIR